MREATTLASRPGARQEQAICDLGVSLYNARFPLATLSHHYPLGVKISMAPRLALPNWAAQTEAVIVEDDYDSEFP